MTFMVFLGFGGLGFSYHVTPQNIMNQVLWQAYFCPRAILTGALAPVSACAEDKPKAQFHLFYFPLILEQMS